MDGEVGAPRPPSPLDPTRLHVPLKTKTLLPLAALLAFTSCANFKARRTTETSGTFVSTARSFTILSWDLPRPAFQIASENVADQGLPNTVIESVSTTDWGWFDWVLEIIGSRSSRISGTWGYVDE